MALTSLIVAALVAIAAAVVLYLAFATFRGGAGAPQDDLIESLDEGVSVIDKDARIKSWNEALERMIGCARAQAVGRRLADAVPPLAASEVPRAIEEVLASRNAQTLSHVGFRSDTATRVLQIKIVPVRGGVALLCADVTERTQAEQALKRSEERLALTAAGSNDGLWDWNLRSQELYVSPRWQAIVGLTASGGSARSDDWFERVHPDDIATLKAAIEAHLTGETECLEHEHRIRQGDGSYKWVLCRGVAARVAGRRPARLAGSLTDATARIAVEDRLSNVGVVDPLTGLSNRKMFIEVLGQRMTDYKRRRDSGWFAALYLDLDRFKLVNDSLGHLVGDQLLIAVSRRLESCMREGDSLARLGGDEFALLLNEVVGEEQANAIAFRIQDALSAPFSIGGREVFTSASIGIAIATSGYTNPDEIMRDADTAMYQAKAHGKARHELFDADMHARARDRLGLENDLRRAVSTNDFEVHYQPIVLLASGRCVGFESLVRWTRGGKAISPAVFVPVAEELGLIDQLGTWVLQEACRTFASWQRKFPEAGLDCITVNVSSRQLMQPGFLRVVEQAISEAKLNPSDLRLELTETALLDSVNVAAEMLRDLREFGVKIYLDDFGTGYSSLSHLHRLPVDALKIDRSFVRSLTHADRPAIVESILALARTLNTSVVAEGVEGEQEARELLRLGCTYGQGYLFSRPLSQNKAEEFLAAGPSFAANLQNRRESPIAELRLA